MFQPIVIQPGGDVTVMFEAIPLASTLCLHAQSANKHEISLADSCSATVPRHFRAMNVLPLPTLM